MNADFEMDADESTKNRFWSKINVLEDKDACWDWVAGINSDGRGVFYYKGKDYTAHRIAIAISGTKIPKDMLVLHKCDNKVCCNPSHLYIGTSLDNVRDMYERGRAKTIKGEDDPKSKLKEGDVLEIRRLYKKNEVSQFYLGRMFNVSRSAIQSVLNGRSWKHVL